MKRYSKLLVLLLCFSLLLTPLYGCGKAQEETKAPEVSDTTQNQQVEEDGIYITLYYSDIITQEQEDALEDEEDRNYTQTMVAQIPEEELTPEKIVQVYNELVIQGLYGEEATVNEVSLHGKSIKVDFDGKSLENLEIEPGYEGQLFYNLARSLWANIEGVDNIYLTMDHGKDFRLGHLWFEASRPFYYGEGPSDNE